MGGGPSRTSSTSNADLPGWMQPYAQQYLNLSQNTYAPGGQLAADPYPNQQVADFTPFQRTAADWTWGLNEPNFGNIQNAQNFNSGVMGQGSIVPNALNMQNQIMGQNAM